MNANVGASVCVCERRYAYVCVLGCWFVSGSVYVNNREKYEDSDGLTQTSLRKIKALNLKRYTFSFKNQNSGACL